MAPPAAAQVWPVPAEAHAAALAGWAQAGQRKLRFDCFSQPANPWCVAHDHQSAEQPQQTVVLLSACGAKLHGRTMRMRLDGMSFTLTRSAPSAVTIPTLSLY